MGERLGLDVIGLDVLLETIDGFPVAMASEVMKTLEPWGEIVKADVQTGYLTVNEQPDVRGAGGIASEVRPTSVRVWQTIRKSDDPSKRRPNYGPRMYRYAFYPAFKEHEVGVMLAATLGVEEAKRMYWDGVGWGSNVMGEFPVISRITGTGQPILRTPQGPRFGRSG